MRLSQQFERLFVLFEKRQNICYDFNIIFFTTRVTTLTENKLFCIVFKVKSDNIFLALKVTIKSRSAYARFFGYIGNGYFFVFVSRPRILITLIITRFSSRQT